MIKVLMNKPILRHAKIIEKSLKIAGYQVITDVFCDDRSLFKIIKFYQPVVILPVTINDFSLLARNKEALNRLNCKTLVPDYSTWFRYYDKGRCYELVLEAGIKAPKTFRVFSKEEALESVSTLGFPLVLKYPKEGGSRFVRVVKSDDELLKNVNEFMDLGANIKEDGILLQEFIEGRSCGYFALAKEGEIYAEFGHIRVRENPPWGGVSCVCESFFHKKMFEYGRKLIKIGKYTGVCMVEFKMTSSEEFYWIETNPKFWGSVLLPIVSGVNFPVLYVRLAIEGAVEKLLGNTFYKKKIQYVFCDLKRTFKYKPWDACLVIKDFLNPLVKKDIFFLGIKEFLRFYFCKK